MIPCDLQTDSNSEASLSAICSLYHPVPYYLFVLWYYDSIFDSQNDGNRNFTEKFISMASVFHQNLIIDSDSAHIFKLDCLFRYFLIFPHSEIPSGALLFVFSISIISSFLDFLGAIMMPLQRAVEIQTNDEPLQIKMYDSRCKIFLVFFLYFIKV